MSTSVGLRLSGSAVRKKGEPGQGQGISYEGRERDSNLMCRNSDTVANRKKKRVALMGLEKGWDQGG